MTLVTKNQVEKKTKTERVSEVKQSEGERSSPSMNKWRKMTYFSLEVHQVWTESVSEVKQVVIFLTGLYDIW